MNSLNVNFIFFFSWKDIIACFGFENLRPYFVGKNKNPKYDGYFRQQNNIYGYSTYEYASIYFETPIIIKYILKDVFGCSNGSLQSLIDSAGLSDNFSSDKKEMDAYKTNMGLALIEQPSSFVKYAMNDAVVLSSILNTKIENSNSILIEVYKIKDSSYDFDLNNIIPLTVGSFIGLKKFILDLCNVLHYNFLLFNFCNVKTLHEFYEFELNLRNVSH